MTHGPGAGTRSEVTPGGTLRVGYSSSCELSLADAGLEVRQFRIQATDDAFSLTDLSRSSTTTVNGRRVRTVELGHGDEVSAGDVGFQVEISEAAAEPAAAGRSETAGSMLPPASFPGSPSEPSGATGVPSSPPGTTAPSSPPKPEPAGASPDPLPPLRDPVPIRAEDAPRRLVSRPPREDTARSDVAETRPVSSDAFRDVPGSPSPLEPAPPIAIFVDVEPGADVAVPSSALPEALAALLEGEVSGLYAVIDASLSAEAARVGRRLDLPVFTLLDPEEVDELAESGPCVVPLVEPTAFLEQWLAVDGGRSGVLLESRASFADTFLHLRQIFRVAGKSGETHRFRFYAPAVLHPYLQRILARDSPDTAHAFFGTISRWVLRSPEDGQFCVFERPSVAPSSKSGSPEAEGPSTDDGLETT